MRDKENKLEPQHVVTAPVSLLTLVVAVWLSLVDWSPRLSRRPPSPSDAGRWPVTSGDQARARGQDGGGHQSHSQPIIRGHLTVTASGSHPASVLARPQLSSEGLRAARVIIAKLF